MVRTVPAIWGHCTYVHVKYSAGSQLEFELLLRGYYSTKIYFEISLLNTHNFSDFLGGLVKSVDSVFLNILITKFD